MLCIIGVTLTTGGGKWYRAPLSMAGGSKKKIGMGVEVVVPSMKSSECFEVQIVMQHVGVMDRGHTIIVASQDFEWIERLENYEKIIWIEFH